MKPLLVINFKTYLSATGVRALKLAKICEKVAKEKKADIRICVQATDISKISSQISIPVYAQHIDAVLPDRNTGFITAEAIKLAGAKGTLINHSEHRINNDKIREIINRAKKLKINTILCVRDAEEAELLSRYNPDFIAVEPPELIGGDISISSAKPELIKDSVNRSKVPLLVGAGVHNGEDVRIALSLGARGVLVASAVATARYPEKVLKELIKYF